MKRNKKEGRKKEYNVLHDHTCRALELDFEI